MTGQASGLRGALSRLLRRFQRDRLDSTAEIIATVSHEIRSPLTTIKGFTKTMIDRWDRLSDEAKLDMLRAVNADADRVTRLLTELLEISRLEAGKLGLHQTRMDVRELAEEVCSELAGRSEHHDVKLEGGGEIVVMGDREKLRQVLTNFIENALKYTEGGAVRVTCEREGRWGRVAVKDSGQGIPARQLAGLFEKFARHEHAGAPSGTGLGLYISRGLIEAHGGEIGANSAAGAGSTFWFRVPLAAEI
ncbi:MAG: sensor histidine kinase [Candidatus Binatia bacterium]